jgi:branched-chain amino acid transport system substrate-binding protein
MPVVSLSRRLRAGFAIAAVSTLLWACGGGGAVRFAAILPLSGGFEIYGEAIRRGVDLALRDLQAREDYPYEVAVTVVDSQGDPERAAELLAEQYGDGAIAAIGGVTTPEALRMVAVADRNDRILLSPSATSPELTGISKNFYRLLPTDQREGTTMGNFAARKLGLGSVVILTKQDAYARGNREVFAGEFERNGGSVLEVIEYPPGAADFSGFIERVLTLSPDGVYIAAYAEDVGRMLTLLRDASFEGSLLTTSAFASPTAIERVGNAAEGVFLTQAVFETETEDPVVRKFVRDYQAAYGELPDLYAAHGYDSVMVLADAILELDRGPVAADMWKGIRKLKDYAGVTGTIQFDERGDVQKFPRVYVIEQGNLVDYEREVTRRRQELLDRLHRLQEQQRQQSQSNNG